MTIARGAPKPARAGIVFYVSGHGFGHATRSAALLQAVVRRCDHPIVVRSQAPSWIFTQRVPGIACTPAPIDVGLLQPGGLDIDLAASLAAHEAFGTDWDAAVEREARWISRTGADLVVADIPALAFAAAARAGVRAVAVGNFGWDWILDAYTASEPRWLPIVERHRDAYATADQLFRLPLCGDMSAFPRVSDVPLLVNRADRDVDACRRALGIAADERRRVVLVSFGGLGRIAVEPTRAAGLDAYLFVGIGPAPAGFAGDWLAPVAATRVPHERLIRAADAVLGKPGFSTVAEVLVHERRFLYVSRSDFRENDLLARELANRGCAREMPRADFEAGRWRTHLDALFDQTPPPPAPASDGAERIAAALLR